MINEKRIGNILRKYYIQFLSIFYGFSFKGVFLQLAGAITATGKLALACIACVGNT